MTARYDLYAGYNSWANERLYGGAARLSDAEYLPDQGAFFDCPKGALVRRPGLHRVLGFPA